MTRPQPTPSATAADQELCFRQLCETLGVALIATDTDLRIRVWNAAATRMFGAAADRMIGTPLASMIPQDNRRVAERLLRRVIRTGQVSQLEFQHRDTQGRHRELAATIAAVVAESGERIGASVCFRDITSRIELHDKLEQSRKMAALGEMAGALAHHFNNILGGALTRIDYAKTLDDPGKYERMLDPVGRALTRAIALVNGLLAFSEGDRRTSDIADLTEIVTQVVDEIERKIQDRGIEFTLKVPPLRVVPLTQAPVATILGNIAQNAIEAMPDGGALGIEVILKNQTALFRIADTGVGLRSEDLSRIFEPFWSTKSAGSGGAGHVTGMGLAIAHGLAHMIGGSILVESEPSKGSCFTVILPIEDAA